MQEVMSQLGLGQELVPHVFLRKVGSTPDKMARKCALKVQIARLGIDI